MRDFSRLDKLLKGFVEQGTNPGCAVAIMQGDELVYHGEAGYADVESGKKVDVHNMRPNEELYHHHRVRAVVNGIML